MIRLLVFTILGFVVSSLHADQVDNYINSHIQSGPVPGIGLMVLKDGKEIKASGYGVANMELDVPATRETVFELGALSAQFTAAAIVQLNEAGKLSYDDPINKYLPDAPSSWKDVTIRQCLTHTSGIKSYTFIEGFELRQHLTQQKFVRLIGEYPLESAPGTKVAYTPTDGTLLGFIVSNVSGQDYWTYIQQKIFRPLNMTSTYNRDPITIIPNRATGYVKDKSGRFTHRDYDLTDMFAAADATTTVVDFAKWDNALNDNSFFTEASRRLLWTSGKFENGTSHNNGFIFRIGKLKNQTEYSHVGSTGGFCAAHMRYPESKLTIIVLANNNEPNLAPTLARGIANFYLNDK